jgi:hypothetical protein
LGDSNAEITKQMGDSETHLTGQMGELETRLTKQIAESETRIVKWMVGLMIGGVVAVSAIASAVALLMS